MVLRSSHALTATAASLLVATSTAGCKASLFDDGKLDDPEEVGELPECPADCLGDASRDFDGSARGIGNHWRYLDDHRDRTWAPMTRATDQMIGADPATMISKCTATSTAPACAALPGALLFSTAGATSGADPAIEFTVDSKRVVKLGLRVFVPTTAVEQQVRIYRNSREDVLFAGPASPGVLFEQAVSADALPGDRLLVAVVPASGGAADVGVELFLSDVGTPSTCQVALGFEHASGTTVPALCGAAFTSFDYDNGNAEVSPLFGDGPFPELGKAAVIQPGKYYKGAGILDKAGDFTAQYWVRVDGVDPTYGGWVFSDLDLDSGGGIGNVIYDQAGTTRIDTTVCTSGSPLMFVGDNVPYPNQSAWRFVRMVHTGGSILVCIDGKRETSFPVAADKLNSGFSLYLGKNVRWTPAGAFFNGAIDDVRVLSTALPCE